MVAALAVVTWLTYRDSHGDAYVMAFWVFVAAVLLWGLLSHLGGANRYTANPLPPGKVLALVPSYNEPVANVHATVRSMLAQTARCDIIVIDDGSVEPVTPFPHPRVRWIRQDNGGKRRAQITGLHATERGEYDYILTMDGDSAAYPDALEHLLRAMAEPEVWAATGWVVTRNYGDNWVARCADLDIGVAMVMNRSSRTGIGAIETMSGALALYRAELLWEEAEEYLSDNVGAGDDRWLTARALLRGKAVGVNEAIVETDMPTEVKRTYQQRIRWCKSTYLMAGYSIARYRLVQLIPSLINFIYIVTTPVSAAAALVAEAYNATHGYALIAITWADLGAFLAVGLLAKVCLSGLYLLGRPNMPVRQKLISLAASATLLFVFSIFAVILPKYAAIFKLREVRWTTREIKGRVVVVPQAPTAPVRAKPEGRRRRAEEAPPQAALAQAMQARAGQPQARSRRDFEQTAVMGLNDLTERLSRKDE